ncbi:LacI family DNA-binding transcriptional regulator [Ideonella alba]|nr:LacI family DNA-binding transcriptional regulator [Ideonella alba]
MPRTKSAPPSPATPPTAGKASRLQMADIARLAGVSVSTVSRALAGSSLVNEATRLRVAELARSLNYTINVGAQNLRLKQNRTIAVVVPYDPATRQHLSDPFFLSLIGSLADALTDRGYEMLVSRVDVNRLDLAAQSYEAGRAAGIVLVGQWHHHEQLNELAVRGVPLVVWGAQLPGQAYATVGSDNVAGGQQMTRHLIERGARRIAFMGDTALEEIGQRHRGYLQALAEARLQADPALTRQVPFETAAIEHAVETLLADGTDFDALFCASDLMAMTAIGALQRLGRRVPQQLRVGGYDDIALAAHYHPSLTTVRQPIEAAGEQLVAALLEQLDGARPASRQLLTELVLRDSSR